MIVGNMQPDPGSTIRRIIALVAALIQLGRELLSNDPAVKNAARRKLIKLIVKFWK